jgi:hypothetical protein
LPGLKRLRSAADGPTARRVTRGPPEHGADLWVIVFECRVDELETRYERDELK